MKFILNYLGHGRMLESFLGTLKIVLGIWILTTNVSDITPQLADLAWWYPALLLAGPFFLIGGVQLAGLAMNIMGLEISWVPRALAASCAVYLWVWLMWKSIFIGTVTTWLVPLAIVALPYNAILLWKAWNRLPVPGSVGLQ